MISVVLIFVFPFLTGSDFQVPVPPNREEGEEEITETKPMNLMLADALRALADSIAIDPTLSVRLLNHLSVGNDVMKEVQEAQRKALLPQQKTPLSVSRKRRRESATALPAVPPAAPPAAPALPEPPAAGASGKTVRKPKSSGRGSGGSGRGRGKK